MDFRSNLLGYNVGVLDTYKLNQGGFTGITNDLLTRMLPGM